MLFNFFFIWQYLSNFGDFLQSSDLFDFGTFLITAIFFQIWRFNQFQLSTFPRNTSAYFVYYHITSMWCYHLWNEGWSTFLWLNLDKHSKIINKQRTTVNKVFQFPTWKLKLFSQSVALPATVSKSIISVSISKNNNQTKHTKVGKL